MYFTGCGSPMWKTDKYCDDKNNNVGCNWDGGACCYNNYALWDVYCKECKCLDLNAEGKFTTLDQIISNNNGKIHCQHYELKVNSLPCTGPAQVSTGNVSGHPWSLLSLMVMEKFPATIFSHLHLFYLPICLITFFFRLPRFVGQSPLLPSSPS